jgi:hypothetical protein
VLLFELLHPVIVFGHLHVLLGIVRLRSKLVGLRNVRLEELLLEC